jgi:UDP-N-acetylmuramate dehydrogenase
VVRLRGDFENVSFKGNKVIVGGGVHLPKLAKRCAEQNLAGVEGLAGVPGTVGGALMSNAGTPRGVIGDVVSSVSVLTPAGDVRTLNRNEIELTYRHSNLAGQCVVAAALDLKPAPNGDVMVKIKEELAMRERTQPLGTKNVGSVFKNPPNDYAARLIEAVGLKGNQVGQVRFSPKHANFMENLGGASAAQVQNLMTMAQQRVKEKFNVDLEPEVKIIQSPRRA